MIVNTAFQGSTLRLRVELRYIAPPIWRRLVVPADATLDVLHDILQAAFGWTNSHLHDFQVGDARFGMADVGEELLLVDERAAPLGAVACRASGFLYRYDYGDGWEHAITVENVSEPSREGLHALQSNDAVVRSNRGPSQRRHEVRLSQKRLAKAVSKGKHADARSQGGTFVLVVPGEHPQKQPGIRPRSKLTKYQAVAVSLEETAANGCSGAGQGDRASRQRAELTHRHRAPLGGQRCHRLVDLLDRSPRHDPNRISCGRLKGRESSLKPPRPRYHPQVTKLAGKIGLIGDVHQQGAILETVLRHSL